MGDLPIYVAGDSSDVASHPDLFRTDVVAGVPPDYFSATGQLWGNPIYRWDKLQETGYEWWIDRFRAVLAQVDMVRLDHFRGFEAYWEVPAGEKTAMHGRWVKGPGAALFHAVEARLGKLPIIAENLGVITPEVEAIRQQFGYPGMSVLQFAFGNDPQGPSFRPHNYPPHLVAYTGTHDNDTTLGWWNSAAGADSTRTTADIAAERDFTRRYLRTDGTEMNWVFIQTIMASVADTVLVPMQDVLGLGTEARMNLPGRPDGNWRWRMRPGSLRADDAARLRALAQMYDRRRRPHAETATELLADLEHELRLPRHSVRLGTADGQHERDLRVSARQARSDPDALARGSADRPDHPADHRAHERPHLEPAWAPAAVLPRRGHSELARSHPDAELTRTLDGGGPAVDSGCIDQRQHGAVPGLRGGPAARRAADRGFAMQSIFIGLGAVAGSAMPYVLSHVFHVSQVHAAGTIPASIRISYYLGAAVFFAAVMWTIGTTREYPPEDLGAFRKRKADTAGFGRNAIRNPRVDSADAGDDAATGARPVLHLAGAILHVAIFRTRRCAERFWRAG